MISEIFINQLQQILKPSQIITDFKKLEYASKDETHGLKPHAPEAVVLPSSTHEVSEIVKLCLKHDIFLTPRGAGTGKSGGAVPLKGGLVIDFSKMNRILEIDVDNLIATVETGVILSDFKKAVSTTGLFYPPDPASHLWCSIGGNIAENASGPSSVKYGTTKDYVLGLTLVLASGDIVKIGKNTHKGVTGYDLVSLICGSEGTLALITQATLKLLPKPKATQTALLFFDEEKNAAKGVTAILQGGFLPKCVEYIDETSIQALRVHKSKQLFPAKTKAALMVEFDANSEEDAMLALENAIKLTQIHGLVDSIVAQNDKQREIIWNARESLSEAIKHLKKFKVSEDIVVPRGKIPQITKALKSLGKKYGLETCAFGHAGDGSIHAQILFEQESERQKVDQLLVELFQITIDMGGTLTGEHGIGIAKQDFLKIEQSNEVIELQKKVKNSFDPTGFLNPGKFLP